jgi:amino-acid N-acetyltransferase
MSTRSGALQKLRRATAGRIGKGELLLTIRKARLNDVPELHRLISYYAGAHVILPRTLTNLYENVWEFTVAEDESGVVGCAALRLYSEELAEIRSLCVDPARKSQGIGREISNRLIREADGFGVKTVFALTMSPEFFEKLGFREAPKERFPAKVWRDCLRCEHFSRCNEKAVMLELADLPADLAESTPEAAEVSS